MDLHLGSIELNFLLQAHEMIVSQFKANKRFIEKDLSNVIANAKKYKKQCKEKPGETLTSIESLLLQIQQLKNEYKSLCELEDAYFSSF